MNNDLYTYSHAHISANVFSYEYLLRLLTYEYTCFSTQTFQAKKSSEMKVSEINKAVQAERNNEKKVLKHNAMF